MPQRQLSCCTNCSVKLDEFNRAGRLNSCKDCYNRYKRRVNKANYHDHVGKVKQWHKDYHLRTTYGLDSVQLNSKLETQFNGCAICKLPFTEERKMVVDHDHTTNEVRDLLCYSCNTVLGLVNDNEERLFQMIEYLKRHDTSRKSA